MKKFILLLFVCLSTLCIAQSVGDVSTLETDTISTPVPPEGETVPNLPWGIIGMGLLAVEAILRMLPIPAKWTIIGVIQMLYKAIPNNAPDKRKLPMWIIYLLGASLLASCAPTGRVTGIEYDGEQVCAKGRVSFKSPVPLNQDSLLEYVRNKYVILQHLKDSADVRNYEWRICSPESLINIPLR